MSFDLKEAFGEFVSECEEITQRVSHHLQELEKGQFDDDVLDAIYRDVHTLKGSANLYGFGQLGQLAHAMEAGLEIYRKRIVQFQNPSLDVLFSALDLIERLIKSIAETKTEPDVSAELSTLIPYLIESTVQTLQADMKVQGDSDFFTESLEALQQDLSVPPSPPVITEPPKAPPPESPLPTKGNRAMANSSDSPDYNSSANGNTSEISQTIRVQIARLDKLMNLIGEMVLVRNQVLQFTRNSEDSDLLKLGKRLDLVTSEMQGEVMQTRMQPIGTVLEKFNRVVRDLNKELGKKIELVLLGAETEVDKSLLEAVKDPLTHLIRNACDHGLEKPEERRMSGKPETGTVTVNSYHEGGQIVIEISDNGRGLDRDKILAKAIERNLVSQGDTEKLSDKDIYNFIFEPGFSTSANITTVSGRGVGMDVVRTNIEKIGGSIELSTKTGLGSTIRLRIPLTLAIVPAMAIRVGSSRFAIPQVKLVELVRAHSDTGSGEAARNQVEMLQGRPMYRMRGQLLPLVSLKAVLKLEGDSDLDRGASPTSFEDVTNIVVLNGDGVQFGLIVDEILDTTDIVVKPISKFLKNLSVYSGATIVGDGSVVLILDVGGIAKRADLNKESEKESLSTIKSKAVSSDSQEFLLFRTGAPARHAMALCLVQRLEEFDRSQIEFAGQQPVIRYRNSILPLIFLDHCLNYKKPEDKALPSRVPVVVVQKYSRNFGFVVDEILDVISSDSSLDDAVKDRPGMMGTLLHGSEVIVMIDALELIDEEFKKMNSYVGNSAAHTRSIEEDKEKFKGLHILYAEDTAFFRRQVTKSLESKGIKVTAVTDGQEALAKLESAQPGTYSIVLSDIEMPNMTGFELAENIRASEKLKSTPLIALTTRFKNSDQEEGRRVGFNLYLEKFNSDQVLKGIESLLNLGRKSA